MHQPLQENVFQQHLIFMWAIRHTQQYAGNHALYLYQISEVVSILSSHESARVAEAGDVLDVGLQSGRVCFQHDVDERWQEVVCRCGLFLAHFDGIEDVLAAPSDACQLVLGHAPGIHFNHI